MPVLSWSGPNTPMGVGLRTRMWLSGPTSLSSLCCTLSLLLYVLQLVRPDCGYFLQWGPFFHSLCIGYPSQLTPPSWPPTDPSQLIPPSLPPRWSFPTDSPSWPPTDPPNWPSQLTVPADPPTDLPQLTLPNWPPIWPLQLTPPTRPPLFLSLFNVSLDVI